jgi:hypothetical protein
VVIPIVSEIGCVEPEDAEFTPGVSSTAPIVR